MIRGRPDVQPGMSSVAEMQSSQVRPASGRRPSGQARKTSRCRANLSIEELSPDDMGYDADIEILRPNHYEDAESESEEELAERPRAYTVDEDLANRMRHLGREQTASANRGYMADRGLKRTSRDLDDEGSILNAPGSPGLEVQEVVDGADLPSPAKRRKKKGKRSSAAQYIIHGHADTWTDSSDRAEPRRYHKENGSASPMQGSLEMTGGDNDAVMEFD